MANPFKSEFDELKSLGLTPQQIKEAVEAKKALEEKATKLETDLGTVRTELETANNSFNETKNRLDALEANSRVKKNDEPKNYTSVLDDEEKAFNERFADKAQPLAVATMMVGRNTAKMEARLSLRGQYMKTAGGRISLETLWDRWMPEIEDAANKTNSPELINSKTWINIFDYIKGKHISEMLNAPETFIETVSTETHGRVGNEPPPEKLNDEELATVAKMQRQASHITPEKYLETKKKMKFVNV